MKSLAILLISTSVLAFEEPDDVQKTPEEAAFEKRFNELADLGTTLNHLPTPANPWGSPNPDAPAELQQFAFMVGRSECTAPLKGINPSSPNQVLENKMVWFAYYALDGRAIRDEFYAMGSNGEQTRAFDTIANEWWVTWATVPGLVSLTPEPKPKRGSFTATQIDGDMVMVSPAVDSKGVDYITTVTFFDITDESFEWKSENIYPDNSIQTASMSCHKVAGPNH